MSRLLPDQLAEALLGQHDLTNSFHENHWQVDSVLEALTPEQQAENAELHAQNKKLQDEATAYDRRIEQIPQLLVGAIAQ